MTSNQPLVLIGADPKWIQALLESNAAQLVNGSSHKDKPPPGLCLTDAMSDAMPDAMRDMCMGGGAARAPPPPPDRSTLCRSVAITKDLKDSMGSQPHDFSNEEIYKIIQHIQSTTVHSNLESVVKSTSGSYLFVNFVDKSIPASALIAAQQLDIDSVLYNIHTSKNRPLPDVVNRAICNAKLQSKYISPIVYLNFGTTECSIEKIGEVFTKLRIQFYNITIKNNGQNYAFVVTNSIRTAMHACDKIDVLRTEFNIPGLEINYGKEWILRKRNTPSSSGGGAAAMSDSAKPPPDPTTMTTIYIGLSDTVTTSDDVDRILCAHDIPLKNIYIRTNRIHQRTLYEAYVLTTTNAEVKKAISLGETLCEEFGVNKKYFRISAKVTKFSSASAAADA